MPLADPAGCEQMMSLGLPPGGPAARTDAASAIDQTGGVTMNKFRGMAVISTHRPGGLYRPRLK
jgi:hypothetical protein